MAMASAFSASWAESNGVSREVQDEWRASAQAPGLCLCLQGAMEMTGTRIDQGCGMKNMHMQKTRGEQTHFKRSRMVTHGLVGILDKRVASRLSFEWPGLVEQVVEM